MEKNKKLNVSTNMVLKQNFNLNNKSSNNINYIIDNDNQNNNMNNFPNNNNNMNRNNMIQSQPNINPNRIDINNFENLNINNEINNNNINYNNNYAANNFTTINPLSQYKDLGISGKGHFGTVRKVQDMMDGKIYALKEMDMPSGKKDIQNLKREAQIPLNFDHPNIIRYYKSFEYLGKYYFVAEFFESINLKELLKKRKSEATFNNLNAPIHFDQNFIIKIFRQLLSGLIYLHSQGIAHRDIKPDNILINSNDQIKITDFGLSAYLFGEEKGDLLGGKTIVGTAQYGPPEIVFFNNESYDCSCDIFSLGYTIFELMNFQLPTKTIGEERIPIRMNNQDGFYNIYLADLVDKMYAHEKNKRPTAEQCLTRLNEIENSINRFNSEFKNNFMNNMNNFNNNMQNNNMNNFNNNMQNNNMNNFINNMQNNSMNILGNNIQNNNMNNISNNMQNSIFNNNNNLINNINLNNLIKEFERMNNNFLNIINQNMKQKRNIEIQNKKLLTSMKCLLKCFYNFSDISYIFNEIEKILMRVNRFTQINNYFAEIFFYVYKKFELKEKNLINEYEFKKCMNDFIIQIFDRQGSFQIGTRPIILYYNILTILNNELNSLRKYIDYNISSFTNHLFYPTFKQQVWPQMIDKIIQYKQKYNNPFIHSFSFLLFSAHKCPLCNNVLEILPQCQVAFFLQLDIKRHDESIYQLIKNYFLPKQKNVISNCFNCGYSGYVLEQNYMMNSPNYLVLELTDQFNVEFETKININEYKASNEGPYQYQLISVIIYNRADAEFDLRHTSRETNWNNLPKLSFNSPSMAIYQKIL